MSYFNSVSKIYHFKNILTESILISALIILIDELNLITKCIGYGLWLIAILMICCCCIGVLNISNFKKIISKGITEFDKYLLASLFILILISGYFFCFNYNFQKIIIVACCLDISLIFLIIRICRNSKIIDNRENTLDLKDICDKKTDIKDYNSIVLLEETDVKYDLLDRKNTIDNLYNVITRTVPTKAFTVGLNGEWGSGKTTIVNNVLEKMRINKELSKYVVIRFDPWKFNDEKVMLQSLVNEILKKINFSISSSNSKSIIQNVMSLIFPDSEKNIISCVLRELDAYKETLDINEIVNNYLESNGKKMLIIIDNLDRIDGEKAIFLIKCLDAVLSFKNTINVLLYEEGILNRTLQTKFGFEGNYMEKMVQLRIDVPLINIGKISVIANKVADNLVYDDKKVIEFMSNKLAFESLRFFKRYVNSIITFTLNTSNQLNSADYSILLYIKLKCPELYSEIMNNKKYYITYDRKYDFNLLTFDYEMLNKEAGEYFDKLYKNDKYKEYIKYAENIFPNMKKSRMSGYMIFGSHVNDSEYVESVLNNRISNARYFDLYFTYDENDFTRLKSDVFNMLFDMNRESECYNKIEQQIAKYNIDELKVFMEILDLSLYKIDPQNHVKFIKCLIEILPYMKRRTLFGELDSEERAYIIISKLLSTISKSEFDNLKILFDKSYKNLSMLSHIEYWIDVNKKNGTKYAFDFNSLYDEMCHKILEDKIDIYNPKNYQRGNIWALYHYNNEKTREYLKSIASKNNIYLILNDLISTSSGTGGYGYLISDENIKSLVPEINIDKLMKKHNLTEKEEFIRQIYEKSINQSNEFYKGIQLSEYREL